jgi:phage-related minor tail protein
VTAVAGLGITIGATLFAIGTKFEDLNNVIIQKTGASGAALKGLEGAAKDVFSSTLGATFTNVGQAISEISVRTGLTGKALEDFTSKEIELGKITKTDVGQNVQDTTALFNLFGIAANKQSGELDILFKASQASGVGISDLTTAMKTTAPVAQMLGLNFNQAAALTANLTAAGLPAAKTLAGLSTEFAKAAKAGKDPTSVLADLEAQLKAAPNATDAATIAVKNFGIGAKQAATLVAGVRSGALDFNATLAKISAPGGGIDATAKATATIGDKFKLLKDQAETALAPLAAKFLDFATLLVDKISPAISFVVSTVKDLVEVFKIGFGQGANGPFEQGTKLERMFVALGSATRTVIDWMKNNKQVLIDVGIAIAAIAFPIPALIAGLVYLYEKFKVVRDIVAALSDFFVNTALPAFVSFVEFMRNALTPLVEAFSSRFSEIASIVKVAVEVVAAVIYVVFKAIQLFWETFHATIMRIVTAVWNQIKLEVTVAINIISDIIKLVLDLLTGHWSKAWNDLLDILKNVWNLIYGTVANALSIVGNLIGALGGIFLRAMEAALAGVVSGGEKILLWFADLPLKILAFEAGLVVQLFNMGVHIIEGLINGIGSMVSHVTDSITNVVTAPINAAKHLLGIGSPSKVFDEIGQNVVLGFANGLGKTTVVSDAMNKLAGLTAGANLPQLSGASGGSNSPTAAGGGFGAAGGAGVNVTQHIHPTPGMSEVMVGRISAAEISWASRPVSTGTRT